MKIFLKCLLFFLVLILPLAWFASISPKSYYVPNADDIIRDKLMRIAREARPKVQEIIREVYDYTEVFKGRVMASGGWWVSEDGCVHGPKGEAHKLPGIVKDHDRICDEQ